MNQKEIISEIKIELSNIRALEDNYQKNELIKFHSKHKYFLFCFDIEGKNRLGRILGSSSEGYKKRIIDDYSFELDKVFESVITYGKLINALTHMAGYFKDDMEKNDYKKLIFRIENLSEEKDLISSVIQEIKDVANLYDKKYIKEQSLLNLSEIVR